LLESIVEALKIVLEKHLIPTVISLFVACIVILFTPADYWMIIKITPKGFFLMIVAGCFLIVQLILLIHNTISENRYWKKVERETKKEKEEREMEYLWSIIDEVNPGDLKIIKRLINSGNKPIEFENHYVCSDSILKDETFMVSRQVSKGGKVVSQYKLRPEIYNNLLYSKQKYGKISHFQDDKGQ